MTINQFELIEKLQQELCYGDDDLNDLCDDLGLFDKEQNWDELPVEEASQLIDKLLSLKHQKKFPNIYGA
jgi:hypothetical protein